MLWKTHQEKGQQIYICYAEDIYQDWQFALNEKCILEAHCGQEHQNNGRAQKDLLYKIELDINMQVMVMENIKTDLDITNSAWEEIINIIPNPNEPLHGAEPIIELKHLSTYILVKFAWTHAFFFLFFF